MEDLITFICDNNQYAHLIIFSMLILAGLNIPFSEDLLLIVGGVLGSTLLSDQVLHLYVWLFVGCYISAWEAYWIGRVLGPKLYRYRLFSHTLTPKRMEKLKTFYAKHGLITLIIGRFIPFGVRNALFMSAGMSKMPFWSFIWRDGIACFISTAALFYFAYSCGNNYEMLYETFKTYQLKGVFALCTLLIALLLYTYKKNLKKKQSQAKIISS